MRVLALALLLAGCFGGDRPQAPVPSARPSVAVPASAETRQCLADLSRLNISYTPVPDQNFGGGCALAGTVMLNDIGVAVTNLKPMRCGLARTFVGWARGGVTPAAREILGGRLVRIETFGSYACRNVIGNAYSAGRRSGHAIANAVDVAAFVMADGRRIAVKQGWWSGDEREREFLRVIRASACKRFGTVLSPDYNAAHADHLHLEDDRAGFCR
ncbi:extensin family protein [Sphingomonas sp.]|uniref:extensin family protein n=1 Tax=Sphingomonas sp. TaxID=28214 RepID=UPI001E098908|nr:extensin family protein [Sphingomonas sp.]MBX9797387.1 extensin family protein [Sphingomonas sp.]